MKGQMNQIFLFMIAIIIIISTLYIGFRLFSGFSGAACDAIQADFEKNLEGVVQENIVRGSRNIVTVKPPCEAEQLCFVHRDSIGDDSFISSHGIINASVHTGIESNVFLVSENGVTPITYDERITTTSASTETCVDAGSGGFELRTEGRGNTILVSG